MKIDPNAPAYPTLLTGKWAGSGKEATFAPDMSDGITIRALIAKDLLAALMSNPNVASLVGMMSDNPPKDFAAAIIKQSISATDALINRINK